MSNTLQVSVGQHSSPGRKAVNQDFHGASIPKEPLLGSKGVAIALADGISSSAVSDVASQWAVKGFLEDYFCTSDAWPVKASAQKVLEATNSWLHAQTRKGPHRYDQDKGYVCAFSALVIKSTTAHVFHVGDTRVYRLQGQSLEQLTQDHRVHLSSQESYLGRALGATPQLDLDYLAVPVEPGDVFMLATDGVYEHVDGAAVAGAVAALADELDSAAKAIVDVALARGSADNLTVQLVRIEGLPLQEGAELKQRAASLPMLPLLAPRTVIDGYKVLRELHASSRSHIYLAEDEETREVVVLKAPSIDLQEDAAYRERFLLEEWVARRINSAHVLKPCAQARKRNYLYAVTEYVEGRTLAQWMRDHPRPDLEAVRGIVEQIARGLLAFHRLEMLHQDLRPENILIDASGTVKIIDFGAVQVAGVVEGASFPEANPIPGTPQYTAPEYFLGDGGSARSDQFSLGVIAYQMLAGSLPYGALVARCTTRGAMNKLQYATLAAGDRPLPMWVDGAIRKAVDVNPRNRYEDVMEFAYDLRHPNSAYLHRKAPPLLERNPLLFWQLLSLILGLTVLVLLAQKTA